MADSYQPFPHAGLAIDPIHVGTGGERLGRVDMTIVRDPVTRIPKIPGSSLAGVYRTYVAMARETNNPNRQVNVRAKPYFPDCAGLGEQRADGSGGHCGQPTCPICTVFGFASGRDRAGGFAGLAAFSDAHVLLFPVATREGPSWITCPMALRTARLDTNVSEVTDDAIYQGQDRQQPINLGWLMLPVKRLQRWQNVTDSLKAQGIPDHILQSVGIVTDKLFGHVVNSNLEVRTSVAINPATGAAEDQALFSYEALPRGTVLSWEVTCKNPQHFKIGSRIVSFKNNDQAAIIDDVHDVVEEAHPYLKHLGIGGMGTRGMGRLRVLAKQNTAESTTPSDRPAAQNPTEAAV